MRMVRKLSILLLMGLLGSCPESVVAQGGPRIDVSPRTAGTATVTGTVLDLESQHPVRLAQVSLAPKAASGQRDGGSSVSGSRSGLDGTFEIDNVAAGDYYVLVNAEGYVSASLLAQAAISAGGSADEVLRTLPSVHVNAGGSADASVSLQRGGGVGGTVQWSDGLPAAGVQMNYETATSITSLTSLPGALVVSGFQRRFATIDDRGNFRFSGLAQGDYLITATVTTQTAGNNGSQMRVYYPGVFRKTEAKPVSVRLGDERDDLRMTIDFSALHVVSGTVGVATGSGSVRSGTVSLRDSVDGTLHPLGRIRSDGTFVVNYVPAGTYTMTVMGSSQERSSYGGRRGDSDSGWSFAPFTQTITVTSTDVTGLTINLSPAK